MPTSTNVDTSDIQNFADLVREALEPLVKQMVKLERAGFQTGPDTQHVRAWCQNNMDLVTPIIGWFASNMVAEEVGCE